MEQKNVNGVLNTRIQFEDNIPKDLYSNIINQAQNNEHINNVYRVAKWGRIEEKVFLNTYGEIQYGYIPDDDSKYPKNNIGTYSTSVYTERKNCDKFINMLKRSVRLRKLYPYPVVIKGKTSNGLIQKTVDRIPDYIDPTHVDWWLFSGKRKVVLKDFIICE